MWANAQRYGRPAERRWRPLFNATVWLTPTTTCRAVTLPRRESSWNLVECLKLTTIPAASGPKFTILWGRVQEILLLNKFFPIVDTCLSCEDTARQSCGMVTRWRFLATFLGPAFAASRVQHLSDLHSKFALGPQHLSKYGRHPTCGRWD